MTERPFERISARAIAIEAGVDPALVTYHFGGREGLVVAVAEQAAAMLRARMTLGYTGSGDVSQAIRQATLDPVHVLAEAPLLGQLYVSELLLHGAEESWKLLRAMAEGYFGEIDDVIQGAMRRRELRKVDQAVLYQSIAALSLMPSFLGPLDRRHNRQVSPAAPSELTSQLIDFVLRGVAGDTGGRALRRRTRAAPGSELRSEDLVRIAIEALRKDIDADISLAGVAAAAGAEPAAIAAMFRDDAALATAVAREAVRALPTTERRPRTRGRPPAENPALGGDLVAAATELIRTGGTRVTANAVAARAGCDPALVTYYFKGRTGLLQAVATNTLSDLVARFETNYDPALPVIVRLEQALRDPLHRLEEIPSLALFIVDEFLVHGTKNSDAALGAVLAPFIDKVRACVDEGRASGELTGAEPAMLFYGIGVLPAYLVVSLPVFARALGGPQVDAGSTSIADQILDIVLKGILSTAGRRATAQTAT